MITTVIFDFGNVIANFSQETFILKFKPESMHWKEFQKLIFYDWKALDDGEIELDEYIRELYKLAPKQAHGDIESFFSKWTSYFEYNQPIVDLIKDLEAKNIDMYLLSNAPSFFENALDRFDVLKNFKGYVLSGIEKVSKPETKIYQILLDRFNLNPETCLFIDDLVENIEAATKLGMHGIVYQGDTSSIYNALREL